MPSFYPRAMPHQLPLTPPECVSQYQNQGCAGRYPYQPAAYQAPPPSYQMARQEDTRFDYAQRYGQPQSTAAPTVVTYQQPTSFSQSGAVPPSNTYYDSMGGTTLPPMRTYDPATFAAAEQQQRRQEQQPKEEKPVGGVSATLDYDMETMTNFVSEMAQKLLSRPQALSFEPTDPAFRKWVHAVLCATRLPSATILLSLHYLATHLSIRNSTGDNRADEDIHKATTVALILGSKFLDDNTFINRSWAEVSYIPVHVLNYLEFQWLNEIDFQLHQIAKDRTGWPKWQKRWAEFKNESPSLHKCNHSMKLSPLDTNVQRQPSMQSMFSPASAAPQSVRYSRSSIHGGLPPPPAYSQHDPWNVPRSAIETSPRSAPHTGPTTPEYYGGSSVWAPPEGYSRRTMFGFQPHQQAQPQYTLHPPPYQAPTPITPNYNKVFWCGGANRHIGCSCLYCSRHMAPAFMQQAVVG